MAGPGAEGVPGAAAGSARHRPVHPGHPAHPGRAARPAGPGRLPGPVPGRQHRPRRRADPRPADRRRAVESAGPELRRALPGLDVTADRVYRAAYPRVAAKVAEHYGNYPDDIGRARDIARYLATREV